MSDLLISGHVGTPRAEGAGPISAEEATRIRALAAEFESLLLTQMLKDMRASMLDDDDKSTGFGGNPLSESMFSELSLALSRAGGIGIADSLMGAIARQQAGTTPVNALTMGEPTLRAMTGEAPVTTSNAARDATALLSAVMTGTTSLTELPTAASAVDHFGGRVSSTYGWRDDPINGDAKFHAGLDIALPTGQSVPAARGGRVAFAGELPGYGLTVLVEHDGRMATRYAHLSEITVTEGQTVAAGQSLAKSGATGRVTGPHLHFEVLEAGKPVNPERLFNPAPAGPGLGPRD